jgi:4-amino-4-deoxychorismate mutase
MDCTDEIAGLRQRIDEIDQSLITLLATRFELCLRIGALKEQASMPVMQPNRVAEVTQRMAQAATRLGVSPGFASGLWGSIIMEACRLEELRKENLASLDGLMREEPDLAGRDSLQSHAAPRAMASSILSDVTNDPGSTPRSAPAISASIASKSG